MSDDFDRDDISKMREDGDLRAFMRSQFRRPAEVREFPVAAAPKIRADSKPVGAWPSETHKPGCELFGKPDGSCACPAG